MILNQIKRIRRSNMTEITFTTDEKEVLVQKLKRYLVDVEFLLDFFSKEIGVYHYNRGLKDAQDVFKSRVESE